MRHLVSLSFLVLSAALVACGPGVNPNAGGDGGVGGVDGGTGGPCTGNQTTCAGNQYETCQNGTFVPTQTCTSACSPTLGCVDCDPAAGNACNGNSVVACNSDGTFGSTVMDCASGQTCSNGSCSSSGSCGASGVELIYVIDEAHDLLSFDPMTNMFTKIGVPQCSPGPVLPSWQMMSGETSANPFSMAVDRNATAWVLYTSGEIFKVSTADGSCMGNSGYTVQQNGMDLFGMGFVTDTNGGDAEHLYLGGGDVMATPGGKLATVDPANPSTATLIGNLPNIGQLSPELTGTGDAKFYAFFPGSTSAFVEQLDKSTGAAIPPQYPLTGLPSGATIRAWAFAQWGGYFYTFVTTTDALGGNQNSEVLRINSMTNQSETVLQNLPYVIVGAGVSTCAPVVIGGPTVGGQPTAAHAAPTALRP